MGHKNKIKMKQNFKSIESLEAVKIVLNEAAKALNDSTRTIIDSPIPEVIAGAVGAGMGGVVSFAALYYCGSVVGLSAAGITSGLAAAGAFAGGGMVAGVFVLAAPVAIIGAAGVWFAKSAKAKKLKQEKDRLYNEALRKHEAIIRKLKEESNASKERADYLNGLNILLQKIIEELREDLNSSAA